MLWVLLFAFFICFRIIHGWYASDKTMFLFKSWHSFTMYFKYNISASKIRQKLTSILKFWTKAKNVVGFNTTLVCAKKALFPERVRQP